MKEKKEKIRENLFISLISRESSNTVQCNHWRYLAFSGLWLNQLEVYLPADHSSNSVGGSQINTDNTLIWITTDERKNINEWNEWNHRYETDETESDPKIIFSFSEKTALFFSDLFNSCLLPFYLCCSFLCWYPFPRCFTLGRQASPFVSSCF